MKIDLERDTLTFVRMSRNTFRQSSFLDDPVLVRSGPGVVRAKLTPLMEKLPRRQSKCPTHFILHAGYGGSTLLARYLEQLPHCLVLKEPQLLGQLTELRDGIADAAAGERHPWTDQFELALALLARSYPSDIAVVIKPSSLCSWMGNLLLDRDARTKIVFLYSSLKVFLLQILKTDSRRRWAHEQLRLLDRSLRRAPFLSNIELENLDDGQCAAVLWLLNGLLCRSLLDRPDKQRVLPLSGEALIANPRETSRAVANFLGLTQDEANRNAIAAFRPFSHHAKETKLAYDAVTRAADLGRAEAIHGGELQAAISWAKRLSAAWLSQSPFPID